MKQTEPVPETETVTSPKPTHKKLGMIGAKKEKQALSTKQEDKGDETEEDKETDDQRAERKRAELAKELERKAAAGPAKKKRRF